VAGSRRHQQSETVGADDRISGNREVSPAGAETAASPAIVLAAMRDRGTRSRGTGVRAAQVLVVLWGWPADLRSVVHGRRGRPVSSRNTTAPLNSQNRVLRSPREPKPPYCEKLPYTSIATLASPRALKMGPPPPYRRRRAVVDRQSDSLSAPHPRRVKESSEEVLSCSRAGTPAPRRSVDPAPVDHRPSALRLSQRRHARTANHPATGWRACSPIAPNDQSAR
jgi:hypothetical protein